MYDLSAFNEEGILEQSLDKTAKEYRLYDPGWYLYRMIINFPGNKISSDFIELVYVTLCAWNMNSRGAKLSEYDIFEESIVSHKGVIDKLGNWKINDLAQNSDVREFLKDLFFSLTLVAPGKPPLVTFSKAIHFFLPHLVVPIDRKYTLSYFTGNTGINPCKEKQFSMFYNIQEEFSCFASENNLEKFKDNRWNLTIPKVLDNMIIGFMKL